MSTLTTPGRLVTPVKTTSPHFTAKLIASAAILILAAAFVFKYVFRYYLHYSEPAFTDPMAGAPNYWVMRGWLLMHITGGMAALLVGPWQFWTGFRARYFRVHRLMGKIFLGSVAVGSIGAFRMGLGTTFGWAFGFALVVLAAAWATTAGMAYFAIRRGLVQIHKEWMVRAYVVTFAFVIFRVLSDYGLMSKLQPPGDRAITIAWSCWVVPLMVTEVVLQSRRMRAGIRN